MVTSLEKWLDKTRWKSIVNIEWPVESTRNNVKKITGQNNKNFKPNPRLEKIWNSKKSKSKED